MSSREWWEQTFQEREAELNNLFGRSHPPGSPVGYVISLNLGIRLDNLKGSLPGAAVQVFPPAPNPTNPNTILREQWLYLTLGLSQPKAADATWEGTGLASTKIANISGYGAELGILVDDPQPWINGFFRWLLIYVLDKAPVRAGHRLPFGFYRHESGHPAWFVGSPNDTSPQPLDETRAILFWPYLAAPSVTTRTGSFQLLMGTTITQAEYELAKQTSSAHLQLLLCIAGIGQTTKLGRPSVTADERWSHEWQRIGSISVENAVQELKQFRT
jgi:Suppressor of fused protein (SUFU)